LAPVPRQPRACSTDWNWRVLPLQIPTGTPVALAAWLGTPETKRASDFIVRYNELAPPRVQRKAATGGPGTFSRRAPSIEGQKDGTFQKFGKI